MVLRCILGYVPKKAFFAFSFQKTCKLALFGKNGLNAFFFGKNRYFFLSLISRGAFGCVKSLSYPLGLIAD
jgi:hypothetical protein